MLFCLWRLEWGGAVLLVLLCLGGVRVRAQTAVDGAVRGTVVDAGGSAVAGAAIEVRDDANGFVAQAVSDRVGEFLVPRIPAGTYRVTITAAGFASEALPAVVELGAVTAVEARLRVAGVNAAVTVEADGAVQEEEAGPAATTVTPAEIERLPLDGRRWQAFALLTPEANPDADGLLSFRGLAVTQNSTAVDGMDDDQSFGATPRGTGAEPDRGFGSIGTRRRGGASYTFSQEAVREFRVSGQNYSALYGHAAGGVITTVSKGGTNTLHGSGFYLARDGAWGAANPFSIATRYADGAITRAVVKPHDLRQQFGGSLGGAAVRDRLFYFYAFDGQRRGFPAVASPADPAFYTLTPTQKVLLGNRGVSAAQVYAALHYLDGLTGKIDRRADQTVNFGKLDWQAAAKHRLSVQYDRARASSPNGVRTDAVIDRGRGSVGSGYTKVDTLLERWLWTPRSRFSNELRAAWSREWQYEQAPQPLPQEPAIGPGGYAPEVAIGPDGLTFGAPSSVGRRAYPEEHKAQFAEMMTWAHGRHLMQAGGTVSRVRDHIDALNNREGAFHYDGGATRGHAGGLVDWITDYTFNVNAYPNGGCPSIHAQPHYFCFTSFTQSFGESAVTFDTQEWAGYVQERWRARPGLTLNAGLRYEYELLPLPQRPNAALDAVFGQRAATSIFPEDRNNFGPRVGVSWSPFRDGLVVRAGYGVFYGRLPGATVRSALVNTALPQSATHIRIVPRTVTECPQKSGQGFGYACAYVAAPPAAVGDTTSAVVFDRGFRLPMVQQASFGVESRTGAGMTLSATYLANLDRQLPNSVDINIAPAAKAETFQVQGGANGGQQFTVPVYTERVSASFGPVTDVVSNANASYNALVLAARRRSRAGLAFRVSWTWSKAIDYGQNPGATPRQNAQLDPFNAQYDKGLSSLNYPHKLTASAVWQPRVAARNNWLRAAANGWLLSGLFTERSGRPYSYDIYGGTQLAGGHMSINGSGGAVYLPTVGRNTLRLPDAANLNLRVGRVLRATERMRIKGLVEVFNATNHVNYSGVARRAYLVGDSANGVTPLVFQGAAAIAAEGLNGRPFGTFTAATGASRERRVQMGLRVEF